VVCTWGTVRRIVWKIYFTAARSSSQPLLTVSALDQRRGRLVVFESELPSTYAWGWLDQPLASREEADLWLDQHQIPAGGFASPVEAPTAAALKSLTQSVSETTSYPDRKERDLSEEEKVEIRRRLEARQDDVHSIARDIGCASTQVAAIKAWMKMKG
jgi:hypothetical protein